MNDGQSQRKGEGGGKRDEIKTQKKQNICTKFCQEWHLFSDRFSTEQRLLQVITNCLKMPKQYYNLPGDL